jgi:hypothetical protein
MLARDLERLAAGGDHPHVGGDTKSFDHELGSRAENVLTRSFR